MKKIKLLIIFLITALSFSCEDQLELTPISSIVVENFYQSADDAESAVNSIYSMLTSHWLYNQYSETMQSQGTDDAEWGKGRNTSNPGKNEMDKFLYTPASSILYEHWLASYKVINTANTVIERVEIMEIDQAKKDQYIGEAKFLRGLIYFNLVRLWGDVPLSIKSTTTLDGLQIPRASSTEVYDLIVNDLTDAKKLLPLSYSGTDIGRATKGAAMTILCKVYLTLKMYPEVATEAEAVTALGIYSLMDQYAEVFSTVNENGTESIFEVQYMIIPEGGLGSSYAGYMAPSSRGGYGDNPVTKNLYDIYLPEDLRRDVNIFKDITAPSSVQEPYYVNKYDERGPNVEESGDNYFITRYADVLLMHAEALNAISSEDAKAYELLNQVRRRAFGLPLSLDSQYDLEAGLTQEQFLDSVLLERRKEFAFEGQRRFDLLRTGKLKEAMNASNPELLVEDKHLLFPIPQTERLANPNLTQNTGW